MTADNIRSLFLHPQPTYTTAEAAKLLAIAPDELREAIDVGDIEPVAFADRVVLPWTELASFAIDHWSQEAIEEALGARAAAVIPGLLRLDDLHIRIPRIQIAALERLAARNRTTVSTLLTRELRDLVSAHCEWLSRELPGFADAFRWPEVPLPNRSTARRRAAAAPRQRRKRTNAAARRG